MDAVWLKMNESKTEFMLFVKQTAFAEVHHKQPG